MGHATEGAVSGRTPGLLHSAWTGGQLRHAATGQGLQEEDGDLIQDICISQIYSLCKYVMC